MIRRGLLSAVVAAFSILSLSVTGTAQGKKLIVYSGNESTLNKLAFSAFEKETGIVIEAVEGSSGILVRRMVAEKDRPQGDVIWGIGRSLLQLNKQFFAAYPSKFREFVPAEFRDPDDLWIGTNVHVMALLLNTKLVPEGEEPKTWRDLLDPKWKGKIAFPDPRNAASAYLNTTLIASLRGGDQGWADVSGIFANAKILSKTSMVFSGVGNGEYAVGATMEYAGYLWRHNGAPVKVVYPTDGTVTAMDGIAIIKNGPNLEGAKLFVDFITRKDVRELILANTFRRPARTDLDLANLPGGLLAFDKITFAKYDDAVWTEERSRATALQRIEGIIQNTR
ncbi:MAG: extracellular solute-binding protein [Alphaproteobacteria bacterium]|nr:extracellular solute-binding protein [Alphaproteobacteria bacterium]